MYYHVWFVTKYRKPILRGEIEKKIKSFLREIAIRKKYNVLEVETNSDHVHLLLEAQDRKALSGALRTLKAISAKKIFEDIHFDKRYKRSFWARRYGWKEIRSEELRGIRKYIREQKKLLHA